MPNKRDGVAPVRKAEIERDNNKIEITGNNRRIKSKTQ